MPRGSLVLAHETSPSVFSTPKPCLPALEPPGLHFFPSSQGEVQTQQQAQHPRAQPGWADGERGAQRQQIPKGCEEISAACPPSCPCWHSSAQPLRERGGKSFSQVKALKQLQVLDKGTEFEKLLA